MEYDWKLILGIASAIVAFVNYLPYLIGVMQNRLHPHAFSWVIFTIITAVIATAQLVEHAGAGAWATGTTSLTTCLIAYYALKNGGYRVTQLDKLSLAGALMAIPAWILTANPLVAVIILTFIELLGFLPTYRKAWRQPHDESILAFSLTLLKYALALGAMQSCTLTTVLFPVTLIILSSLLIIELAVRKHVTIAKTHSSGNAGGF